MDKDKKVFMSFSKLDQRLEEKFEDFLQLGMGIRREDIFCTADRSALATGVNFCEEIKKQMNIIILCPMCYSVKSSVEF